MRHPREVHRQREVVRKLRRIRPGDTARGENVVPLYRRNTLNERQVLALNEIAGVLDTGSLADMRRQVAEGKDPGAVADEFLQSNPLGH